MYYVTFQELYVFVALQKKMNPVDLQYVDREGVHCIFQIAKEWRSYILYGHIDGN
jgi:hypothetical protein